MVSRKGSTCGHSRKGYAGRVPFLTMEGEIWFACKAEDEMAFGFLVSPSTKLIRRLAPVHPELDYPDDEIPWKRWLDGRSRLETALLLDARN